MTPHCPDCRCVPMSRDAFCYLCGAGVHHEPEDCDERGEFCPSEDAFERQYVTDRYIAVDWADERAHQAASDGRGASDGA